MSKLYFEQHKQFIFLYCFSMRNKSFGAVPMCRSNQQSRPTRLSGDENTGPVLSVMNSLLLSSSCQCLRPTSAEGGFYREETKILCFQQTLCSSPSLAAGKHEKGKAKRCRGQNRTEMLSTRKSESHRSTNGEIKICSKKKMKIHREQHSKSSQKPNPYLTKAFQIF